jgi:choline-sulfatase
VLYLTIDAMRSDMPWEGYPRPIAPHLTKLAEQGVVYDDFRSVASYTAQSIATMLSGQHASTLYRNGLFFTKYSKSNTWFTETLQEKGIKTAGVQAHRYFDAGKNLDQGFDVWKMVPGITFDSETDRNVTSDKAVKLIREILSDKSFTKGQWFLWSHFTDPHDQYIRHEMCPDDWGKKNRDRYDCEIYFTDHYVGELLDWARTQPWFERTAIIVSSDHGELFGEHGQYKHAFRIWDGLVKVPAIFVVPGAEPRHIAARRTHIDLAPTIMDLMGLKPLPQFEGKTMVPEIFGAEPDNREPIVLELVEDTNNPHYRAIIKGDYKLIVEGGGWNYQLFNLARDPGEENDLAEQEKGKLKEMKELLDKTFAKIPSVQPYGGNKLHSGRIARGPMGPDQDPKRK